MSYHYGRRPAPLPARSTADTMPALLRRWLTFGLWVFILIELGWFFAAGALLAFMPPLMWLRGRNVRRPGRGALLAVSIVLALGLAGGWPLAVAAVVACGLVARRYA